MSFTRTWTSTENFLWVTNENFLITMIALFFVIVVAMMRRWIPFVFWFQCQTFLFVNSAARWFLMAAGVEGKFLSSFPYFMADLCISLYVSLHPMVVGCTLITGLELEMFSTSVVNILGGTLWSVWLFLLSAFFLNFCLFVFCFFCCTVSCCCCFLFV